VGLPQPILPHQPRTMGKQSKSPTSKRPPNMHLFARLSHLYQASTALSIKTTTDEPANYQSCFSNLSRFYISHLRSIAKKSVLRLDPSVKRTICKKCDSLLIPGVSCLHRIENTSKGGKKKWADVLVVECTACKTVKRFPMGKKEPKAILGKNRVSKDPALEG
jgi:ribonuclease P protein subunit RPR2